MTDFEARCRVGITSVLRRYKVGACGRWLVVCATVFLPTAIPAGPSEQNLVPAAFATFKFCADAGIKGIAVNDAALARALLDNHGSQPVLGAEDATVHIDVGPDYRCDVVIAQEGFEPVTFREAAEVYRKVGIAGDPPECSWMSWETPLVSVMACAYGPSKFKDGTTYRFSSEFILLADGPAFLRFYPTWKTNADGTAVYLGDG